MQIAIDGPVGSGKSAVAGLLAKDLGFVYIQTGAMYRAVGCYLDEQGIGVEDVEAVSDAIEGINLVMDAQGGVFLNGIDYSERIISGQAGLLASKFSALAPVRKRLVAIQKELGETGDVVMEGRDIGTNVMPKAQIKIFLTAEPEVRARRRYDQLVEAGLPCDFDGLVADVIKRDYDDSHRALDPLKCAEDAVIIDTGGLSICQVVDKIKELIERR